MKLRDKNPAARAMIGELAEKGLKVPAWRAVAEGLNRPGRKAYEADIARIEKTARKGESVVVPGTVLGKGELSKPISVAALRFTASAEEKIKKAGGKCMSIPEMVKQNPEAKKVRIMG